MTRLTRMNALRTAKSDGGEYVFLSFFSFAYLCLHTIGEHELRCGEAWKLQKWRQLLTCRIVLAIELLACCELSRVWSLVHMEVHSPIASISFQSWIVYCVMVEGVTLSAHTDSYLIWFHFFSFALFFSIYNSVRECEALQDHSKRYRALQCSPVLFSCIYFIWYIYVGTYSLPTCASIVFQACARVRMRAITKKENEQT